MRDVPAQHGDDHIPLTGNDPIYYAGYTVIIFGHDETTATGDSAFIWTLPKDVYGKSLRDCEIALTVVDDADTVVQLHNVDQAVDMLDVPMTIDAGKTISDDDATAAPRILIPDNCHIVKGDRIRVDVDAAGSSGMGLHLHARFW